MGESTQKMEIRTGRWVCCVPNHCEVTVAIVDRATVGKHTHEEVGSE